MLFVKRAGPLRRHVALRAATLRRAPATDTPATAPRGPLRRVTPLKAESAKRRGERDARTRVRASTLARDGHRCVAALMDFGPCGGPLEVDEIVSRSRRPGGHLDDTNTQTLCRLHNQLKATEPALAHALGLARHSWE